MADEFSRLRFVPSKEPVITEYPELAKYKELSPAGLDHADKYLRYVIYAYDRNSPLHKMSGGDTLKRKRKALEVAGIIIGAKNIKDIEEVLDGHNMLVNQMIVRYMRIQGDVKFSLLMSRYDSFNNSMFLIMSNKPTIGGDLIKEATEKNKFAASLHLEADMIQKLSEEVFYNEPELMVVADEMIQDDDGFTGVVERYAIPARQ